MGVTPPWALRMRDLVVCLGAVAATVTVIVRVVSLWVLGHEEWAVAVIALGVAGGCVGAAWVAWTDRDVPTAGGRGD